MPGGFDLQQVRADYWLAFTAMVTVIAATAGLGMRVSGVRRSALFAVATVLVIRVALLENPLSWRMYAKLLDAYKIGWRQYDLVKIERDSYLLSPQLRYLAVGSSQTDTVYGAYAQKHEEFGKFIVAAMMPMDFVLYAHEIARRRPETVLLYLSDFDIAKRPPAEAIVVAPGQGVGLLSVVRRMQELNAGPEHWRAILELAVGEVLPEFRFRFVFRGILDTLFNRVARKTGRYVGNRDSASTLEERVTQFRALLAEENMAFNLAWLEDFLRAMSRQGIRVVIVEGHYHPIATNAETLRLNVRVRKSLEWLAEEIDDVRFIPRTALERFSADDYRDLTHVNPAAGERFTHRLLDILERPAVRSRAER